MISKEQEATILRLFHADKWEKTAIATEVGVHHSVVTRTLKGASNAVEERKRPLLLEPYVAFIKDTLERYPKMTASRLHRMVSERGYTGGPDYFRHAVRELRPTPKQPEAFLRLK